MKRRRSKYGAKKTQVDGYTFDSQAEARHYQDLRYREQNKEISGLVVHPKFILQPGFTHAIAGRIRPITYTADFQYILCEPEKYKKKTLQPGQLVVDDVKGSRATLTDASRLRMKLAQRLYPTHFFKIVER